MQTKIIIRMQKEIQILKKEIQENKNKTKAIKFSKDKTWKKMDDFRQATYRMSEVIRNGNMLLAKETEKAKNYEEKNVQLVKMFQELFEENVSINSKYTNMIEENSILKKTILELNKKKVSQATASVPIPIKFKPEPSSPVVSLQSAIVSRVIKFKKEPGILFASPSVKSPTSTDNKFIKSTFLMKYSSLYQEIANIGNKLNNKISIDQDSDCFEYNPADEFIQDKKRQRLAN
jgi:hypothetical protein